MSFEERADAAKKIENLSRRSKKPCEVGEYT